MRLNEMTTTFETARMTVSQAKATMKKLMTLQGSELDAAVSKKLDSAINNLGKVLTNVYDKIDFKQEYVDHSDSNSLYNGDEGIKEGYNADTVRAKAVSLLINIEQGLKKFSDKKLATSHQRIIDHSTMKFIELDKKYFSSLKSSVSAISDAIEALNELSFEQK